MYTLEIPVAERVPELPVGTIAERFTRRFQAKIDLPGCQRAHGVRVHPDGRSAFVACENNNLLIRLELAGPHGIASAATGQRPDVLAIDPGLG